MFSKSRISRPVSLGVAHLPCIGGVCLMMLAGLASTVGQPAHAASKSEIKWEAAYFNPQPLPDDVVLPMPCGGAMTFRKVLIPVEHPMDDYPVTLGSDADEWGFLESTRDTHIAGSFAQSQGELGRYYLLGKYEVSELQYEALMTGACPAPATRLRRPRTSISWFDAVDFADRYSQWLLGHHPDALPREDGMSGFLRLPTEVEWSFAARGGLMVSPSEFQERVFPMAGPMSQYVWFAGPQSSNGTLRPAGVLEPNPLGLHDVLGNADEMMFEPFQMRTHGRAHGQSGGYVVRGASYLTPQEAVRSAWRVEQPYYRDGKRNVLPTTGFRLAVVAPAVTSAARVQALESQWVERGRDQADTGQALAEDGASERLERLAMQAENEKVRQELNQLRDQLRAANQLQREQRERAMRSSLQLGGFLCAQIGQLAREVGRREDFIRMSCDPVQPRSSQQTCANIQSVIDQTEVSLNTIVGLYSDTIVELGSIYPEQELAEQARVAGQSLRSRKGINLEPFADTYLGDLTGYMRNRKVQRQQWLESCSAVAQ
ncbi:formylglycine-generating enzyme family protein [Orrella marina]|uniref:Sulfatase-modifying factor enzyme-like domain-containing protein n=1 Tax=Orrella marina TaxID=2163011 RepID=A0A2R4XMC7_9BURK|nr:SUMF1/EgtB/PvdO family nonheme iron enzyme [Orrella marina]AWB34945.1 hypothetical protein DBV39_15790 [Orrella marina]